MEEISPDVERLVSSVLEEDGDTSDLDQLSDQEKKQALQILREFEEKGFSPTLESHKKKEYEEVPVSVEEFVKSPRYLGNDLGEVIYPRWLEHMKEFLDPDSEYTEVLITGAIGTGKTTIMVASVLYHIYRLLCLKSPQKHFGLMESDEIVFGVFNKTLELAEDACFQKMSNMIWNSPYFKEKLIPNPRSPDEINFPKNIGIRVGSKFTHALGQHVFSALIDEANFQGEKNKNWKEQDIMKTYNSLLRRMESRFMDHGKVPGQLFVASSKNDRSSWLEVHLEEHGDKETSYVIDEPIWKIVDRDFSDETFRVMVGDQRRDSRILGPEEEAPDGYRVIEVPEDYRESFERDVENSLRDIAGVSTYSGRKLITNRQRVRDCVFDTIRETSQQWEHPFPQDPVRLDFHDDDTDLKDHLIVDTWRRYRRAINLDRPRAVHIDLGAKGDALGFAMSHIAGRQEIEEHDLDGEKYAEMKEVYRTDLMFRAKPVGNEEIPIDKVVDFVIDLRDDFGFNIQKVTTDGWQSIVPRQRLRKKNFKTDQLSVDRDDIPYLSLKNAFLDYRVEMYPYEEVIIELFDLMRVGDNTIDHPKKASDGDKGRKDVADGLCGSIFTLIEDESFDVGQSSLSGKEFSNLVKAGSRSGRNQSGSKKEHDRKMADLVFGDYIENLPEDERPEDPSNIKVNGRRIQW